MRIILGRVLAWKLGFLYVWYTRLGFVFLAVEISGIIKMVVRMMMIDAMMAEKMKMFQIYSNFLHEH